MSNEFDVFSIGRSPIRIDIITKLKELDFKDSIKNSLAKGIERLKVNYLNLDDLIKPKKTSARHKDLDDLEKLLGPL